MLKGMRWVNEERIDVKERKTTNEEAKHSANKCNETTKALISICMLKQTK